MTSVDVASTSAAAEAAGPSWWVRYTRWRPTSRPEALAAEAELMRLAKAPCEAADTPVGPGRHDYMHSISNGSPSGTATDDGGAEVPLVWIPGYCTGSGLTFRIWDGLAAGLRVHAVDPLGTGLSGRPRFRAKSRQEAEDFFVDSLQAWREAKGLDQFVLAGHSLGGYLAAVYAMRHPQHVRHLLLVSPAGVVGRPADWKLPPSLASGWTLRRAIFKLAVAAWEWDVTPATFIRAAGPWGTRLADRYCRTRFAHGHHLSEAEAAPAARYLYHATAARGSGEFALRHLLYPFAWPYAPIGPRMADPSTGLAQVPVTFIYGQQDWMDAKSGAAAAAALRALRSPLVESDLQVLVTRNAGHYLFVDQPSEFVLQVADALRPHLSARAHAAMAAAARRMPFFAGPSDGSESAEALADEMERDPAAAGVHVATDM